MIASGGAMAAMDTSRTIAAKRASRFAGYSRTQNKPQAIWLFCEGVIGDLILCRLHLRLIIPRAIYVLEFISRRADFVRRLNWHGVPEAAVSGITLMVSSHC